MCIDFHALNAKIKLDIFLLPHIADSLDKLDRDKYFSSINLAIANYQVRIAKVDTHKTIFLANEGLHEYFILLFGLCNALSTFQRLINLTFANFINDFVTIYLDNILAYSETY